MKNWKINKTRKHMLFVPADKPAMYRDVVFYRPDTIMFDLEDAIAPQEKDNARILLEEVLTDIDYNKYGLEVCVRINGLDTPWTEQDIEACVKSNVNMIRIPKVESVEEVAAVIRLIEKYEHQYDKEGQMLLFLAFESAKGVLNAYEIAQSSPRIQGIALGGVDYLVDLKAQKLPDRTELLYARQHLVHVARALKIDVFDVIYGNINDSEGFIKEFKFIKGLGFSGKSVIHPNQIALINEVCKPTEAEVEYALEVEKSFREFSKSGKGVFQFRGNMIDKPVMEKQEEVLNLAVEFGMIEGY